MPEIKSVSRGRVLWEDCELADTPWKRFRGIMLRRKIDRPLLFVLPSESVARATILSFFCIGDFDAVFLDSTKRVVDVKENIGPWRPWIAPGKPAKYLIECSAGEARKLGVSVGERHTKHFYTYCT